MIESEGMKTSYVDRNTRQWSQKLWNSYRSHQLGDILRRSCTHIAEYNCIHSDQMGILQEERMIPKQSQPFVWKVFSIFGQAKIDFL